MVGEGSMGLQWMVLVEGRQGHSINSEQISMGKDLGKWVRFVFMQVLVVSGAQLCAVLYCLQNGSWFLTELLL